LVQLFEYNVRWSEVADRCHCRVPWKLIDCSSAQAVLDITVRLLLLLLVAKWWPLINFISKGFEILAPNSFPGFTVAYLWCILNTLLIWRLIWIDTSIFTTGFCITDLIRFRVKKMVAMWIINEWMKKTVVLNHKTIFLKLFR
jgi:hypothetical protein